MKAAVKDQPVSQVRWLARDRLRANAYNPNHVAAPELELLLVSILEDGWTQPIVTLPEGEDGRFQIVDGFHRWTVSGDPRVAALTGELVPTVQLLLDPVHRMMSTIRHNRARGTHAVVRMAEIVRGMVDDGVPAREIQKRLGMEREEVTRLINRAGMPSQVSKGRAGALNRAWVPGKG
jgi:ParB-like chromosome segregation protein Spo0J